MRFTEKLQGDQRVDDETRDRLLRPGGEGFPFVLEENVVLDAEGNPFLEVFAIVTEILDDVIEVRRSVELIRPEAGDAFENKADISLAARTPKSAIRITLYLREEISKADDVRVFLEIQKGIIAVRVFEIVRIQNDDPIALGLHISTGVAVQIAAHIVDDQNAVGLGFV